MAAAEQLIQPDRSELASHARLLTQFGWLLASGGGLIRALDTVLEVKQFLPLTDRTASHSSRLRKRYAPVSASRLR